MVLVMIGAQSRWVSHRRQWFLALALAVLLLLIGDAVLLSPIAEAAAAEAVLLNVDAVLLLLLAAAGAGGEVGVGRCR